METNVSHKTSLSGRAVRLLLTLLAVTLRTAAQEPLVGSLGGELEVSSLGLATYSIPIEVVPGTRGVQPTLAVTYSSAGGRGMLGSCWTLTGLSSITRVPRTPYHDGDAGSVSFDAADRYALDGERLVRLSQGPYAASGAVYGKEAEDFTRVTLEGVPDTDSQHFTAVTADGAVVEYGTDGNSKQRLNGHTLAWWVRRVTDPDGNYMVFQYSLSDGETLPTIAYYTGNADAGLATYAQVTFEYTDDPNPNKVWVGGQPMTPSRLLSCVKVRYGDEVVRQYCFEYDHDRTSRLTAVVLCDAGGVELTRTTVTWGQDATETVGRHLEGLPIRQVCTGDFDGDNATDLLLFHHLSLVNLTSWTVRRGDGSGGFTASQWSGLVPDKATLLAIDTDADGTDEVGYIRHAEGDTVDFVRFNPTSPSTTTVTLAHAPCQDIIPGRFLGGDGLQFLFVGAPQGQWVTVANSMDNSTLTLPAGARLSVTDLNGNGKSDLQVVNGHQVEVYERDASAGALVRIAGPMWQERLSHADWFADVNGDGYMDYLYHSADSVFLRMSKGNDYTPSQAMPLHGGLDGYLVPLHPLMVGDVNGDGKDDIVQPADDGSLTACLSRRLDNGVFMGHLVTYPGAGAPVHGDTGHVFADFDGDGQAELLYMGTEAATPLVVSFPERRGHDLAASLTDGYGMATQVAYGYYGTPHVGWVGSAGRRLSWPLATRVATPDGLGGRSVTFHSYGDAVYDPDRQALLGFLYHNAYRDGMNRKEAFLRDTGTHRLALEQQLDYLWERDTSSIGGYVHDPGFWRPARVPLYHRETLNTPATLALPYGRFVAYNSVSSVIDRLRNAKSTVATGLTAEGRVRCISTAHARAEAAGGTPPAWAERDSTVLSHLTVTLPNGRQATLIDTVTTWHRRNGAAQAPWRREARRYAGGRLASVTIDDSDGSVATTAYARNALGATVADTLKPHGMALSLVTSYQYDNKGRFVTAVTDPMGHTTQASYDKKTGLLISDTDQNGLVTTYAHDPLGRVTCVTRPDGTSRHTAYEWNTDTHFPDAVARVRETGEGAPETVRWTDVLGRTVHSYTQGQGYRDVVYDHLGRVAKTTFLPYDSPAYIFQRRVWRTFAYDAYGRTVAEDDPLTNLDYEYYDPLAQPHGNYHVTLIDSVNGTQRTTSYDAIGRPSRVVDAGGTIAYAYDYVTRDGRVLDRTRVTAVGSTTTILNDTRGNRMEISDSDAGTVASTYDVLGRLVERTDARGVTASYTYDLLGRVLTETLSDGVATETVGYAYDNAPGAGTGRLASVTRDGVEEVAFGYDGLGRVARMDVLDGGERHTHLYGYDRLGRPALTTYPSGFTLRHTYNDLGEPLALYDDADNSLVFAADTRDRFRNPLMCRYGNGTGVKHSYDNYGRLTAIRNGLVTDGTSVEALHPDPEPDVGYFVGNEYRQLAYAYDARGFIVSRSDANTGQAETFAYDGLGRLTSHNVNGVATHTFAYDSLGNIASGPAGSYQYDPSRPHAVTRVRGALLEPQQDVSYGLRNRPVSVSEGSHTVRIDYAADGQRRRTDFLLGGLVQRGVTRVSNLHEVETSGGVTRRLDYVWFDGRVVAVHVANGDADSLYYVLPDHLGSWDMVLDQDGAVAQSTHFDPWGNRMDHSDWGTPQAQIAFPFRRGFTGHEHYDRFRLVNANARLYDPAIGRFLSPDPFVQMPDFTQSFNRYSYCLNNPMMYSDPSGELFGTVLGFISDVFNNLFVRTFSGESWDWTQTKMGWKIDKGLLHTDPNKSRGGRAWEFFSRLTWQLPQTLVGDLMVSAANAFGKVSGVTNGYGMTVVDMNSSIGAVTVGFYSAGPSGYKADWRDHLFVHEYGHYVQSQQHGPAYLFSVALPSLQSAAIYTMTGIPHRTRWFEADASYKGSAYFDRYYGSGKEGYTAGSPEFFDKYSFTHDVDSPYSNPRKRNYNRTNYQISATYHWTTIPISIFSIILVSLL